MSQINKDMKISEILSIDEGIKEILFENGMHCLGCPASQKESLADAAKHHGIDIDTLILKINNYLNNK